MTQKSQLEEVAKSFIRKDLPDSALELVGEIPTEALATYKEDALKHIATEVELPGFRKGHVPTEIALKKVGEVAVLEEAVEMYMQGLYPALLDIQKIDPVGRPDIQVTKLPVPPAGGPIGITVHLTLYPTVELPKDWQKIANKIEIEAVPDVLDAEVDEALSKIRAARATQPATTVDPTLPATPTEPVLPALDDAFAQSLGQFTDLADLKVKLKENMKQEKEQKAKEARRGKIIESLLDKTNVAVPAIFVDSELEKIMGQMKEDVQRFGLSFDDYLKRMQKTEAQVKDEFREQARKRAKLQLALNKLAEDEKIEADKEKVDEEMKHALEHFPDARPELVRIHIETVLRNEKTLQLLEGAEPQAPKA